MKNKHLNDAEIQQYVLQKTNCDIDIIEHIQHCENCKIKAEHYKFLFEGIKQQEKPAFDFDLANLVIKQLPQSKQKVSSDNFFGYFIVFIAILFVSTVSYLFRNYLLSMFSGIAPIPTYLIITTVVSLLIFLCIDIYTKFQKQMTALNFY
jgi:hypothetical protein